MIRNPMLSICIPTYNREVFLRECLASLQVDGVRELIEVVVSDNASTDNTWKIRDEFSQRLPLRWIVQSENIGPDRNFDAVITAASGEYCWLLGSDDVAENGAVERLIEGLRTHGTDIFHFGYIQANIHLKKMYRVHPPEGRVEVNSNALASYLGGQENMSLLFTFISSFAFRRSIWMTRRTNIQRWVGSNYIQTYAMHSALMAGATLAATNECLVIARGGNPNEINSTPGRFVDLDARTIERLMDEVYEGCEQFLVAMARPFRRSYPLTALISEAVYGGFSYIGSNRRTLGRLGYPEWFVAVLYILGRLRVLRVLRPIFDFRKWVLRWVKG